MNDKKTPELDPIGDWIKLLHAGQIVVHACATPYRLMVAIPGTLGRWSHGMDTMAGLMFAVPIMCQHISSRMDGILCKRLWAGLWLWFVVQTVAAHLLNRRWDIHSREFVGVRWLPGGVWTATILSASAYWFVRPVFHGLGTLLSVSAAAYVASCFICEMGMRATDGAMRDGEIQGREYQRRWEGR